jgi:hypothetical protein
VDVAILLACGGGLLAAELSLPARVPLRDQATLPLTLRGAEQNLTALQCDLQFDGGVLDVSAAPGPASSAAGKSVVVRSLGTGRLRLIVAGMNRTAIRDGAVVVVTVRARAAGTNRAEFAVRILNAAGASADGNLLRMETRAGSVTTGADEKELR